MNKKLLVTLLQKNIQELEMITQGFMEMKEFPMPIILLAQRKTDDIQLYIKELSLLKEAGAINEVDEVIQTDPTLIVSEIMPTQEVVEEKTELTNTIETIKELILDSVVPEVEEKKVIEQVEELEIIDELEEVVSIETQDEINKIVEIETTIEKQEESLPEPEIITMEEVRKTILGERNSSIIHTRNELLSKADNSISSTLANKKITDIKQAINIGDRFRFQRELFRGNGEDMNKTLTYINQLASLDEVLSFLQSKYGWTSDNETADDFYQIVRRRFI